MNNRVSFATFDLFHDVPKVCGVCMTNPPIFRYEFSDGQQAMRAEYMKGFCCAACTAKLLEVLEDEESREWTHEEGAREGDEVDVRDFEER